MCRTFLTVGRMSLPEELGARGDTPDFVNVRDATSVVKRRWGKGGLGIEWARMSFGMSSVTTGGLMSHVLLDRAEQLRGWEGIATRLCAVPISGFRWRAGGAWTKVSPSWAAGFYEEADGSFLLVASGSGEFARPLVADWAETRQWLMSEQWEQMRILRRLEETVAPSPEWQRATG